MGRTADVVIVGGGVIGLTTAYELLRAGARVTVLERGEPGRAASWAGAGIIPPGNPRRATEPDDQLRAQSADRWPTLSAELREITGIDNGYQRCGGFEHVSPNVERWRAEGIAFEPAAEGYFLPGMAQVRNPWHLRALAAAVVELGGQVRTQAPVIGFERTGEQVSAVAVAQESVPAGEFLVCGGAWTDELLAPFGVTLGVRPVRGQMILYEAGDRAPRHIHVWDKEYMVPRGDGLLLVGSTEEDAGFAAQTTHAGISRLRSFAARVFPKVATSPILQTWAGLRPGSIDGRPYLGRVSGLCNLWVAAGHFRSGIGLSPATGQIMAQLLLGIEPALPLAAFRPGRPAGLPGQPAFRS
jgi:glycine oxidase